MDFIVMGAVVFALLVFHHIFLSTHRNPIDVLTLNYNNSSGRLELTLRNKDSNAYYIKPSLRLLIQPAAADKKCDDDGMLEGAFLDTTERYTLLAAEDQSLPIDGNETRTFFYDVSDFNLQVGDDVKVSVSYGKQEDNLGCVFEKKVQVKSNLSSIMINISREIIDSACGVESAGAGTASVESKGNKKEEPEILSPSNQPIVGRVPSDQSFKMKASDSEILYEIHSLEELRLVLEYCPLNAVRFHMNGRNDFASWVRHVFKEDDLAEKLSKVEYTTPEEAKARILEVLGAKIN